MHLHSANCAAASSRPPAIGLPLPRCNSRPCPRSRCRVSEETQTWTSADGLDWLAQQSERIAQENSQDRIAERVGLHIHGRRVVREGPIQEDDPKRFYLHAQLAKAAKEGQPEAADKLLEQMRRLGLVPGPRAFHAAVFANLRAGSASGALQALRQCWDAGLLPLTESYAAVIKAFVDAGDVDTAAAVYASHQRATGAPAQQPWQLLALGLYCAGQVERANEVVAEGRAAGLVPPPKLHVCIIEQLCKEGRADEAREVLQEAEAEAPPTSEHYAPIVLELVRQGRLAEAEAAWREARKRPEDLQSAQRGRGVFHAERSMGEALLAAYIAAGLPPRQLKGKLNSLGMGMELALVPLPEPLYTKARLQIALEEDNFQEAMLRWRELEAIGVLLEQVSPDVLAALLQLMSRHDSPTELYQLLRKMYDDQVPLPKACTEPDPATGCTFVGAWVHARAAAQRAAEAAALRAALIEGDAEEGALEELTPKRPVDPERYIWVDGVPLDPETHQVVDHRGKAVPMTKMTTLQLRAELSHRQSSLNGKRKELAKRLQAVRQQTTVQEGRSKHVMVVQESRWDLGHQLSQQEVLEEAAADDEDDELDAEDEGPEPLGEDDDDDPLATELLMDDGEGKRRRRRGDDEDEEGVDDFDGDFVMSSLSARLVDRTEREASPFPSSRPDFSDASAGPQAAATIAAAAAAMGASLSEGDRAALVQFIRGRPDTQAAAMASELLGTEVALF